MGREKSPSKRDFPLFMGVISQAAKSPRKKVSRVAQQAALREMIKGEKSIPATYCTVAKP